MRNRTKALLGAAALMLAPAAASAEDLGIGVRASTLGLGAEIGMPLTDNLNVRAGLNSFSRSADQTIDGVDYNADLKLSSQALYLDWHPFEGTFHFSVGYVFSKNELTATATPSTNVQIGNNFYTPAQIGQLDASISLGSGPYAGIGWGNLPASGFGFTFELGVVSMGTPDVSLTYSDPNNLGAIVQAEIDREISNMESDLNQFDLYPVISAGISYGF